MPFQLLKISPNKYFVINSKTKMKKEKQPTSLKKATAQLRILEDIEEFKNKKKISKKMSKKISGGALDIDLDTPSRPGTPEWALYGKGLFGGNFKSKLRRVRGSALEGIQVVNFNSLLNYKEALDIMENIIGEVNMSNQELNPFDMDIINEHIIQRFMHENNPGEIPPNMVVVVLKFDNKYTICYLTRPQYNLVREQIPHFNEGGSLYGGGSEQALYGGGSEQDQYKEYLQSHAFGELNPRSQTEINQMHDLYTQSQNYKKLTSVFGVPTIKGGLLPNEQMIEMNRQSAITFEHTLSPQELPYYNYWIKFFGTDIISLWEPGLSMGKLLLYSKNRIATVSAKAKSIIHLRELNPIIPNYNYDEEQRLYLIFYNQLKTQLIAVFNPQVSNEYLHQQLNIQSLGDVEGRARTRAIIDLRQQYVSPNFSYKQAAVDEFQRQHSLITLENQPLQDYKQGYNVTANYIKQFGASYLWNDIHLDTLPDATPYDQGVRYAVISFRAVWEYQAPPPPKKSTWDEVWDAVTTGVELGAEILKVALL